MEKYCDILGPMKYSFYTDKVGWTERSSTVVGGLF